MYITCDLPKSMNKWVDRRDGSEGSDESIIRTNLGNFEFTCSGKFYICQEKVREFQKTSGCGNRDRPFGPAHTYMAAYIRKYPQGKIYCSSSFLYTIAIVFFE